MRGFLVAGSHSGVGKTTITLSLIAALRRRGLTVQAMKGGPDFLDTTHLSRVSGRAARNLDTWILDVEANRASLRHTAVGADVVVVEGMMGLFDGKTGDSETGSSAEIAKLLGLPVILVLDGAKSARSLAATLLGFELFDPELMLAGVVLNRIGGERHFALLKEAIASRCRTPILGWLPRTAEMTIPERHLGLHGADEASFDEAHAAALAEQHLSIEKILDLQWESGDLCMSTAPASSASPEVRIGVARDRAFSFYYEDNLDLLCEQGAEIIPFSPLEDSILPSGLDALYLGGGYPEIYAEQLATNTGMLQSVQDFAASGSPIYAECGGMIYLGAGCTTRDGRTHTMANILPLRFTMTERLVNFGYVTVALTQDCMLGRKGTTLRGHSFHYSSVRVEKTLDTAYEVSYSLSGSCETEGYLYRGILASYIHLHFRAHPEIAHTFVQSAKAHCLTLG